jgi:hypothetical protein
MGSMDREPQQGPQYAGGGQVVESSRGGGGVSR